MAVYYSEWDKYAAEWLRSLIAQGLIPDGDVDERSIVDVSPDDLKGYTQCHFFAGIGGWAYAARLAGWPDDREIWTGSCPCQPFSVAGKGAGTDDPRHLWPHFFRLICARRPLVILGEQVAGKAGYGWFDGVRVDLESEDYASWATDIPSCAIDAPHIRSRLYWVSLRESYINYFGFGRPRCLGDSDVVRRLQPEGGVPDQRGRSGDANEGGDVAFAKPCGCQGRSEEGRRPGAIDAPNNPSRSFWSDAEWIQCHDGKARRTKPSLPLLVDGVPRRVALWRGFGNAINPILAAEVIAAFMDCMP